MHTSCIEAQTGLAQVALSIRDADWALGHPAYFAHLGWRALLERSSAPEGEAEAAAAQAAAHLVREGVQRLV